MHYLQQYNNFYINILSTVKPLIFFPTSMVMYLSFYACMHKILQLFPTYHTYDKNRQYYIMFNISKSSMLFLISYTILLGFNRNILSLTNINWSDQILYKNITALYAITDIAPLFINRNKMMKSTIIHHVCVALAYINIVRSNLNTIGLSNAIIVYGLFSSLAYIVNFYLGFRYLITNKQHISYLKKYAFVNYITACAYNWSVQGLYFSSYIYSLYVTKFKKINILNIGYIGLYMSFLYFWISDDIILMKHLIK